MKRERNQDGRAIARMPGAVWRCRNRKVGQSVGLGIAWVAVFALGPAAGAGTVTGELRQWHRVTVEFAGPATSENASPNPFRDYRLNVTFTNGGTTHVVPGFYAADGNAAETSATAGSVWRVHFTPDLQGTWTYTASFRTGGDVAVSLDPGAGTATSFDGDAGQFIVGPTDKSGSDFRGKGLLRYVDKHHCQFAGDGGYYLKGGADSPENFLGYFEFDGTYDTGGLIANFLHEYQPHTGDWNTGDPTWQIDKGKNIIGALNYLGAQSVNSVYFLTYNIDGGDGGDTWPWTSHTVRDRFDCSKLDQWEIVFAHMDQVGIQLHVVTQETENDQGLDGGALGTIRKLYYRELIARFAHHLAIIWNLGEENTNSDAQRIAFADYIRTLDPYDHPITVHTQGNAADTFYNGLIGQPDFEATSIQGAGSQYNHWATSLRERTAAAGRPWCIYGDEQGPAVDDNLNNLDQLRKETLWGNLMGGGAGVEWYFGYQGSFGDVQSEDFRATEALWQDTRHALDFFQQHLPFADMQPNNGLTSGGSGELVLHQPGERYAVYLPNGGTTNVNVAAATYDVRWYDPRNGGPLQIGTVAQVTGPGFASIGSPPSSTGSDWVALLDLAAGATRYDLTVNDGGGDGQYIPGVVVTITADAPPSGEIFDQWTGDTAFVANVGASTTTVTMPAAAVTVSATYTDAPPGPAVLSFTLINADTDSPIPAFDPLNDGATINLAALSTTNLNIRANTYPSTVGSVKFGYDGNANYRVESVAPYALEGDSGGDYAAWTPGLGSHALTGTPYTGSGAGGTAGTALSIQFNVINEEVNTPPTVAITQPAGGATFHAPLDLTLIANAGDSDGTVTKVEFFQSGSLLGAVTSPPFEWAWTQVPIGDYTLTAVATDDDDATANSAPVTITVRGPGDFDDDGDVDLDDFGFLQKCISGSATAVVPGCEPAILDGDQDIDDADLTIFVGCLSGADVSPDPACPY